MSNLSHTYAGNLSSAGLADPWARTGGSFDPRPAPARGNWLARSAGDGFRSHMPLDTEIHWDWRNPLNIIPAIILLVMAIDLLSLLVS
jgi:hypothetical protein